MNFEMNRSETESSTSVQVDGIPESLTERLYVALESVSAKEELVKQHAKVAEEALSGWEKSKKEVISIKQQLKAAIQKNTSLEERLGHVDDALKECVRQLRQSREAQEERIQDAIIKKVSEWESQKSQLETCLTELQAQLVAKTKSCTLLNHELCSKIEILEKENASLKSELVSLNADFHTQTLDMELSIRAAETASKQHLESIKKMRKLEVECRSLRSRTHKSSLVNDSKLICNSLYGESLTDSQSDCAERMFSLENDFSIPDSWASALITELDQFKNEKKTTKNLNSPVEIDLMDDFLEMERFAALTEADYGSSLEREADLDVGNLRQILPSNVNSMLQQIAMLEEKIDKMTIEREVLETTLAETNNQLEISYDELVVVKNELTELHGQLSWASGEKNNLEVKLEILEANRKNMEFEHEAAYKEIMDLKHRVELLEGEVEVEKPLIAKFSSGCKNAEADLEEKKNELENKYACWVSTMSDKKMNLLEEAEEVNIMSDRCAYKCQKMDIFEPKKEELNYLVKLDTIGSPKLHDRFDLTEGKSEKAFCAQLAANRPIRKVIDAKADLPYREVEEDTSLSEECKSDTNFSEAKKIELVVQLELEHLEIRNLQDKVLILEKQMEKEKALTAEFASRCLTLEEQLSRKRQADLQQFANSNEPPTIRQENEIAQAAGRLAECQRTMAALNLQLKSLATLEDFLPEAKTPESNGEVMEELKGEPKILDFSSPLEQIGSQSVLCSGTQDLSLSQSSFPHR